MEEPLVQYRSVAVYAYSSALVHSITYPPLLTKPPDPKPQTLNAELLQNCCRLEASKGVSDAIVHAQVQV